MERAGACEPYFLSEVIAKDNVLDVVNLFKWGSEIIVRASCGQNGQRSHLHHSNLTSPPWLLFEQISAGQTGLCLSLLFLIAFL